MLNTRPIKVLNNDLLMLKNERQRIELSIEFEDYGDVQLALIVVNNHINSLETAIKLLAEFTQE